MSDIRPTRPGGTPGPRRPGPAIPRPGQPPPRRPVHEAPPGSSGKGKWIAIGAGAVVVVVIAIIALGGKKPEPEPVVTAPPPKPVKIAPPPAPPAPPPPPVVPPPPPPAPVKKAPQDPLEERKAVLAELAKQKREEAAVRVAEAKKAVEQDMERERKEAEEFERRFANYRADVSTSFQEYKGALITGFNADELRLKTDTISHVNIPWGLVKPESIVSIANHVYRGDKADDLLALARFYVDRRLWKEAQAVLQRLKAADDEYEGLAEDFDEAAAPLLTGKGLFQGALKTTGASGLRLTYDWSEEEQGDDFNGPTDKGFAVENKRLILDSEKERAWVLGEGLEFWDELEIEGKATVQGSLLILFHRRQGADFYILELGPSGTVLKKGKEFKDAKELSKNAKAVLKGEQKFKVSVRRRKVTVTIADRPALSFDDPAPEGEPRGLFMIGTTGGKTVLGAPLVISGLVNPDYMKKKIGTIEMEARRSVSKDLAEVRELDAKQAANLMLGGSAEGLSADGMLLEAGLNVQDLPTYDRIKAALAQRGWGEDHEKSLKTFDEWLEKHPGFPSLWYLKGIRHFNTYELGEARDCFGKAVALFPDFYEAHYQIARSWWWNREFAKALEQVKKALEIRPDYANAHVLLGQMRFAVDKKASAEADFDFRLAEKLDADAQEMLHERRRVRMVTRGPRDLGCIFELESPNYLIVTDISAERAKWYASQLEVVRASYLDAFKKWYTGDPRPKPRIAIFNTREAFYTYTELCSTERRENLLGFFDPANNELVLFEDLELDETLQVLYHEAFHHFASAMLKFPPYWWNEGIAEYMSAVKLDPAGKEIKERAMLLAGRLANMKSALRREGNEFFIPFDQIINYTPGQFYGGWVGLHYAQAWTMVHFFYEFENGKYRPLIEQYFDELVQGRTQRQAFDAVFKGRTDTLEKEWLKFTKGLKSPAPR